MTRHNIGCPKCKEPIAEQKRSTVGTKVRALAGLAYGESTVKLGFVQVICPACGTRVAIRGRLVIDVRSD